MSSLCAWMMDAPARRQASASRVTCCGVRGTCGFLSGRVSPLMAASITTARSTRAAIWVPPGGRHRILTRGLADPPLSSPDRDPRAGPLPEPRALLARLHAPRARAGGGRLPPAARAHQVPGDLLAKPRRVLP